MDVRAGEERVEGRVGGGGLEVIVGRGARGGPEVEVDVGRGAGGGAQGLSGGLGARVDCFEGEGLAALDGGEVLCGGLVSSRADGAREGGEGLRSRAKMPAPRSAIPVMAAVVRVVLQERVCSGFWKLGKWVDFVSLKSCRWRCAYPALSRREFGRHGAGVVPPWWGLFKLKSLVCRVLPLA